MNGDGFPDLVAGDPRAAAGGLADAGSVHVFFGGPGFVGGTAAGADLVVDGTAAGDLLGWGVGACDIDGDGRAEILIGAPVDGGPGYAILRTADGATSLLFQGTLAGDDFGWVLGR